MPFGPVRSRLLAISLLLAFLASGCQLIATGSEETAAPTPEQAPRDLLPTRTPPPDEAPSVDTGTAASSGDPLGCLSPRRRAAQVLLPLVIQTELATARTYATTGELGGLGLLGSPDTNLAADIAALQQASFLPVLIASDEEGGTVQRLAGVLGTLPSQSANALASTPEQVRDQFAEYGASAKALGIDVIFGPVLDVGSGPGIASRSYGSDPEAVTAFGRATAEGLLSAGIMPVFKHFPGHGRATADSHDTLPSTPALSEMRTADLLPYEALLRDDPIDGSVGVMIAHLSVPGLSDETPTSLSPATINDLLRSELGFDGLVYTDAMNMGAIVNTFGALEAIELSLRAGSDIVILGSLSDLAPALDHLERVMASDPDFASIIDRHVLRVLKAKGQQSFCSGAQ